MEILQAIKIWMWIIIAIMILIQIPMVNRIRKIGLDYIDQITRTIRLSNNTQPPNVYMDKSCEGKYLVCSMADCTFLFHIEKIWNHGNDIIGPMFSICIDGNTTSRASLKIWKLGYVPAISCPKSSFLDRYKNRLIRLIDIADISSKTFLATQNRNNEYPIQIWTNDANVRAIITDSLSEAETYMWRYECDRTGRNRNSYSGNPVICTKRKAVCWIHNFVN